MNNFLYLALNYIIFYYKLGIGDWGLGIGDWGLGPIPNPQGIFIFKKKEFIYIL